MDFGNLTSALGSLASQAAPLVTAIQGSSPVASPTPAQVTAAKAPSSMTTYIILGIVAVLALVLIVPRLISRK